MVDCEIALKDLSKADYAYLLSTRGNPILANAKVRFPDAGTLLGRDVLTLRLELDKTFSRLDLVKVHLVPVEVFGGECEKCDADVCYGIQDAVPSYSQHNSAIGHIYRRDDEDAVPHRDPADIIMIYVPRSELSKFDQHFGDE